MDDKNVSSSEIDRSRPMTPDVCFLDTCRGYYLWLWVLRVHVVFSILGTMTYHKIISS